LHFIIPQNHIKKANSYRLTCVFGATAGVETEPEIFSNGLFEQQIV
jgi:hypothetical protein